MSDSSFDIVCKVDLQEVRNAVQQATKEIATRFDLKGSGTTISVSGEDGALELNSSDKYKLKSALDVLESKLVNRKVPLKALERGSIESALAGTVRQFIRFQSGIPMDKAKEIVKIVKSAKCKVQASIQGDQVRVSGKKKDDLQSMMLLLRESDLSIEMQFTNYR